MIELKNICKKYDDKIVISNLSFQFKEGLKYCFFGPSGIGKTTLFRILMGLENIDCGSIIHKKCRKSAVFQEDRLFLNFTVVENLLAVNSDKNFCVDIIKKMGLSGEENTLCNNLSGGMKRRVSIARVLAFGGDEYYFDEPFKGLDENIKKDVIKTVNCITEGKTCFFITHDINEAFNIADVVISIDKTPIESINVLDM